MLQILVADLDDTANKIHSKITEFSTDEAAIQASVENVTRFRSTVARVLQHKISLQKQVVALTGGKL